jgi:LDH2 family malate/lactate/ureidoglycolate dehydrogenase
MKKFPYEELLRITSQIFAARGTAASDADLLAELIVSANLRGLDSHGIMRIPQYVKDIEKGSIVPGAEMATVKETRGTALLNVNWNFGQLGAHRAASMAIEKARDVGLGCVGLHRTQHVGCLGLFTEIIARENMVGLATASGASQSGHWVAPWGGREGRTGTNPIAFAAPTSGDPILVDVATSTVSEGKVRYTRDCGEKLPDAWVLNSDGVPTDDPNALYGDPGGAILPLGGMLGYKGFGFSVIAGVLSSFLMGAAHHRLQRESNNMWILALDIGAFMEPEDFRADLDEYVAYAKGSKPAAGHERVIMPGELDFARQRAFKADGVPVPDEIWSQIEALI